MQVNLLRLRTFMRNLIPYRIRTEPRITQTPKWFPILVSIGAVVVALVIGGIIIIFSGGNPIQIYSHIAKSSFGDLGMFNDTLIKATPLILIGLACAVAFRMGLWNIGAEGQFYLGALGASAVVLGPYFTEETSPWVFIPLMMFVGFIAGALWGFIPGYLKAKFNVNEIITTLMMNYIAIEIVKYFAIAVWGERGFLISKRFPRNSWLPRLADYAKEVKLFSGLTLHLGLVFGLVMVFFVWYILYKSKWGYEIRLIGDNPKAAEYAGIKIIRNTVFVMMLSGGLAGLAGMAEVSGVTHVFQEKISPGYGFTGIIVAWLAKLNPFAIVIVAILFGALILAGREIQPSGVPTMIQGVILVCLIASDYLLRNRVWFERRTEVQ